MQPSFFEQEPAEKQTTEKPPKPDFVNQVVGALSDINRLMRSIEAILIDLIAAIAPWLAPVLPAYMVYNGLSVELGMPLWIAGIGAVVTEFLGLSAVSTTVTLWDYNDRRRESVAQPGQPKGKKRTRPKARKVKGLAPVWVAAASGIFYLAAVLVVNVLLDTQASDMAKVAKALLSSLSVIAALILTIRGQHARRLEAAETRRAILRAARMAKRDNKNLPDLPDGTPVAIRGTFEDFAAAQMARNGKGPMSAKEVMEAFDVPQRTAYRWIKDYKEQRVNHQN